MDTVSMLTLCCKFREKLLHSITLLFAPVSSECPFYETALVRRQLLNISNTIRATKSGKKGIVCLVLVIERYCNRNVPIMVRFVNCFSKHLIDFRNMDLFPVLLEKSLGFFRYIFN